MGSSQLNPLSGETIPVIVPYFRAPEALLKNRQCLSNQSDLITIELFIRDNSDDNILFTKAVNEGLKSFLFHEKCNYILVLNQDAFMQNNCLIEMIKVMDDNPSIGICTPISIDNNWKINWAGGADAYPFGVHLTSKIELLPQNPYFTHWANGACMLLRTSMIREIGLLDENMQFICSDSDYSFTARSRGWDIAVAPKAFVEHTYGGSSRSGNEWLENIKLQDQLYFAKKWLSGDLYRSLAVEGDKLSTEFVKHCISSTENLLSTRINH